MIRAINIKVLVERWDFVSGGKRDKDPIDITNDVLSFRFQKSIKTPKGVAQLSILPQRINDNILDIFNPMDVLKIYEFGILKFQGYITRISYTGEIESKEGKPRREATISVNSFGSIIQDRSLGLNLGTALGKLDSLLNASTKFYKQLADAMIDGLSYSEIVQILFDEWFKYIETIGGTTFSNYVEEYLDWTTGIVGNPEPIIPKTLDLFTGTEESISLYDIVQQIIEVPFYELWFDEGPRFVTIGGRKVGYSKSMSYLFLRPTPFDGTVYGDYSFTAFSDMKSVKIEADYLLRFDLAKSSDDSFSTFTVVSAAFDYGSFLRAALGEVTTDQTLINKYLYKPMITQLFFTRLEAKDNPGYVPNVGQALIGNKKMTQTLFNWFKNNDKYISGAITHMVPSENIKDPRIGDRLEIEGLVGSFYVEGIAHTWQYPGSLVSNLTVTRGWNQNKEMKFTDKIFKRSIVK